MLTIFFRAVILYGISIWAIRMMGKRQIGQLQPYELVAALLVADLAAGPIAGSETPLLYGIVPILALMLMHSAFSLLGMKIPAFRKLLNGSSCILVENGLLLYADGTLDGVPTYAYRMTELQLEQPDETLFLLPDGTVPQ